MGASTARNDERAQKYASHYAADTSKRIDQECISLNHRALTECAVKIAETNRESERGESDLAAQWQAANWVFWASIVAGAQLLATMFGLYYVKRTLDATLEAVEDTGLATQAMRRQNELTEIAQRPWVKLEIIPTKFEYLERSIEITIRVSAVNIGQTVAIDASLWVCFVQNQTKFSLGVDEVRRKIEEFNPHETSHIMPGEAVYHWSKLQCARDSLWIGEDKDRAEFRAFAAIKYSVPGDPVAKITERAFWLNEGEETDPFGPNGLTLPIRENLMVEDLVVRSAGMVKVT